MKSIINENNNFNLDDKYNKTSDRTRVVISVITNENQDNS